MAGLSVQASSISLEGTWRVQLDPSDRGGSEHWENHDFRDRIHLPGALQNQGFGEDISVDTAWTGDVRIDHWKYAPQYDAYRQPGHIAVPFFLQPKKHFVGAAWYERDIVIPAKWQSRRVTLTLERPHWQTTVWLDGVMIGTNDSLGVPHVYDLGTNIKKGRHRLSIRVDNRLKIDVGSMAHSVTDHSQGNWNGIIGRIALEDTAPVWIEDLQTYPNAAERSVTIKGKIGNATSEPGRGTVKLMVESAAHHLRVERALDASWDAGGGTFAATIPLGAEAPLWDEFHPELFQVKANLDGAEAAPVTFGLRDLETRERQFILNGQPVFFRGTLECCVFPLTGYPPTDQPSWRKIIRVCKDYGLNHMRFHSWCPPEAAFDAADEAGFYFQIECGVFGQVGDGAPVDDWIYRESERIDRAYGNHPSFMLFTHGNEPHGTNREAYLAKWVNYWKARDSRRLVTTGTAFPILPESQYHVYHGARNAADRFGRDFGTNFTNLTAPVIVHEMGQWCAYPDFDDIKKFNGPLQPKNFEIFRDSLAEHGMLGEWRDFLRASGRLQVECYKEEIEAALAKPGIGGFQLLDLHDFPGQGSAFVGVLDALWQSKGYVTPGEFRSFCGSMVPVARLAKRTWTTSETLSAEVAFANFGGVPLTNASVLWKITATNGNVMDQGKFSPGTLPLGQDASLGKIDVPLENYPAPAKYNLAVQIISPSTRSLISNQWNIWVYPTNEVEPARQKVLETSVLDPAALSQLDAGGSVLFTPKNLSWRNPKLSFQPIFWNRYMFNVHPLQTLGLLIHQNSPALREFPTDGFQDWQWNDIVTNARGLVMDGFPQAVQPIVQVIDDWNLNRRLGLVFECRVGRGRLLVCSADLTTDAALRPAARQLRRSLLDYAASAAFNPKARVGREQLISFFAPIQPSKLEQLGARILETDSEDIEHGHNASNAIDGNDQTYWGTRSGAVGPHHIVLDLGRKIPLRGVTIVPRQDRAEGRVSQVEAFCSNDTGNWSQAVATAKWKSSDQAQTLEFPHEINARYVKLIVEASSRNHPISIAEMDIVTGH